MKALIFAIIPMFSFFPAPQALPRLRRTLPSLLALWLLLPAVLLAGARPSDDFSGERWALLESGKVLAAAAGLTTEKYPDSDYAIADERMVSLYRPDGTGLSQDEYFVKVLTESGRLQNRTVQLSYRQPYSRAWVERLEILKADGRVEAVDIEANAKESIDESQMESNIYDPNEKVLQVNIPHLELGDVVHVLTRTATDRAVMEGAFAETIQLQSRGHVSHLSYVVHAPAALPLKWALVRDEILDTVRHATRAAADGGVVHEWEATNVPGLLPEGAMPPAGDVMQRVLVSTIASWEDVSRWYSGLSEPHLKALTPELRKAVAELKEGCADEESLVRKFFYHVAQNIRYMGVTPEKDRPGFEPHDVGMTFEKKYGVCRDKAALLVAMLREAGVQAQPVLISVGSRRDVQVPDIAFNHAIVAAELKERGLLLMDPTDEQTSDLLPSYQSNQSYLVCSPAGTPLKLSPVRPPEDNLLSIKTTGSLDATGRLRARTEVRMLGINDNAYRNTFSMLKSDERRRLVEGLLKRALSGARLLSYELSPEDVSDTNTPMSLVLNYEADKCVVSGGGCAVIETPWVSRAFSLLSQFLSDAGTETRRYSYRTDYTYALREELSLSLAEDFAASLSVPPKCGVESEGLGFVQTYETHKGGLTAKRELQFRKVEYSKDEYKTLRGLMAQLTKSSRHSCIYALKADTAPKSAPAGKAQSVAVGANTEILENTQSVELVDEHTAKIRHRQVLKVLSYAGKKSASEVHFDYNPACTEVRVLKACVLQPDGSSKDVEQMETNLMDQAWNRGAPRYTGGKTLVLNLPGVEVGSTTEIEWELSLHELPVIQGGQVFQTTAPMRLSSLSLSYPKALSVDLLKAGPAGSVGEGTETKDGLLVRTWTARDTQALPEEEELPPRWTYLPSLSFSVGETKRFCQEFKTVLEARATGEGSRQARERALALCADKSTAEDKLQAIKDEVATRIRPVEAPFLALPLKELTQADTTLQDGYGHVADRAILLHAMLAAAGFQPEFVLATNLPDVPELRRVVETHFLPENLSLVLVRVKVAGKTYYLNDTDQYAMLGTCASEDLLALNMADGSVFKIEPADEFRFGRSLVVLCEQDADGSLMLNFHYEYSGNTYNEESRRFANMTPDETDRYSQTLASQVSVEAKKLGKLRVDFDKYPGTVELNVKLEALVSSGDFRYLDLPDLGFMTLGSFSNQRVLPRLVYGLRKNRVSYLMRPPAGTTETLIQPAAMTLEAPAGLGQVFVCVTPPADAKGSFMTAQLSELRPGIVQPRDNEALVDFEAALEQRRLHFFLFKRSE